MPASILKRPNHSLPFDAFAANDLPGCSKALAEGFDPAWSDESGMTCAMEAASRGHGAALALALRSAKDPVALAKARSDSGMDAFDMAAACGSTPCMCALAKYLGPHHESTIGRGLPWHAVEASRGEPLIAYSWLLDLCLASGPADLGSIIEAAELADDLSWDDGISLLRSARRRLSAIPPRGKND